MSEGGEERAFISIEEWLTANQKTNLNVSVWLLSFSTMVFHFAAVYFFTLQLGSLAMVWIFLWLGNFFAFLFDVPVWILQYYFKSRTLLIFWAISQVIAMLIFANFIFWVTDLFVSAAWEWVEWIALIETVFDIFIWQGLNLLLLVVAAMCYWFTREVNDITLLSYVLNNASPSQYQSIIAQNNLFFWVGSLFWLIISWTILTFNPKLIIFYILAIIFAGAFISLKFFDSKEKVVQLSDIKKFKVYFDKNGIQKAKNDITDNLTDTTGELYDTVRSVDLKEVLWKTKYIFMRPVSMKSKMISPWELISKTKTSFTDIYETLKYAKSTSLIVYWSFSMVLTFGFWDTFASTFLIDFLEILKPGWSYVLLWAIAIPAFATQDLFWKLADKVWAYSIANIWLAVSGSSLILMWLFWEWVNFMIFLVLALANSIWYAICMSLSVAVFLESYNKSYADKNKLTEVDSNASAAPMKILQNLANVVWLVFWWLILKIVWYGWFFFIFWAMVIWLLAWSLKSKKSIKN